MKRLNLFKYGLTALMMAFAMTLCYSCSSSDETESNETISDVKIIVDDSYIGKTLSYSSGEVIIGNTTSEIRSNSNKCVQTFVVNDGENAYMMARTPIRGNEQIVIDAHSTALAMVTMYPLFSPIDADGYNEIVSLIESSTKFPDFYSEVSKVVEQNRILYDVENYDLLKSFNDLIEDLCADVDEEIYGDTLTIIENQQLLTTRATYESARLNPTYIDADITGNKLTLRTIGLTPTYYGTVTHAGGSTQNVSIKSRNDFGGLDLFTRTVGNWKYGEPMKYTLQNEGEYNFNFSRMTPEATADFYLRICNCLLNSLGLNFSFQGDVMIELANSLSRAMINAGSGVNDRTMEPMEWVGIGYDAILGLLRSENLLGLGLDSFVYSAQFLTNSLNWYNRIKGIGNAGVRLAFALSAPETFSFCLCNYNNQVTTCTEASLEKISGDEQRGYAKQKLMEPLTVYVKTIDENGIYTESSNYHRVKFEVTKGDGSVASDLVTVTQDNTASVIWTMGESGEQEVRAVVIDIITQKEISEPVFFKASLDKADVTIQLDWSQHSGRTDIDLHVVDPYGERIYYNHMESESGGYLDRDDRVGPGPEHIRWDNAPAGTYKIYVHYYPNEDEDKSVVSYTVTVNADGIKYQPKNGSIYYDEMVPVGQFTIGNTTRSTRTLEVTKAAESFELPKKK